MKFMPIWLGLGLRRRKYLIILLIITLAVQLYTYNVFYNLNKDNPAEGPFIKSICTSTYENSTSKTGSGSESWKQRLIRESKNPQKIDRQIRSPSDKKFLSIGISTVYRKENYLKQTLTSFINESTVEQRENVVIILYLADLDFQKKNTQVEMISKNFQKYLDSGFLQIIYSASDSIYPPFNLIRRRTYSDSVKRVQWRAKQALDFAFLLSYASDSSEYFMVMEDDISAAPQYITSIRNFIKLKSDHPWIALEFSEFVAIGLLFNTSDLSDMANFLLLFYEHQPVDFLLREFIRLQVPDKWSVKRRIPSVFQHFGTRSTLDKKSQTRIDYSFETAKRKYHNQNPPAKLTTTMKIHEDCFLENAYQEIPGIFWGLSPHNKTEHIDIIFQSPPVLVQRLVIRTGMMAKNKKSSKIVYKDSINAGHVQYSDAKGCGNYKPIDDFRNGAVDHTFILPTNMTCLQIVVIPSSFVVVSEIEIFSASKTDVFVPS